MKKLFVYCTFQKEGFHAWKDAPDEVAFLRNKHRHMYHFKVKLEVTHDDREVEFILLKRHLSDNLKNIDNMSCEQIANAVVDYLNFSHPGRDIEAEVSEDGENGAIVIYKAEDNVSN